MKRNVVDIITLGCSKNLVDSERLMGMLELAGFEWTHDSEQPEGEIAIINTCGFIGDAKEESINTILEFVNRKNNGLLKKINYLAKKNIYTHIHIVGDVTHHFFIIQKKVGLLQ